MKVELKDILPIEYVSDGVIGNAQGDLSAVWKLSLPAAFTLSTDNINKLSNELYQLIRMQPSGTIVTNTNFYFVDRYEADIDGIKSISERNDQRYYHHMPILKHEAYITLTLTNRKVKLKQGSLKVSKISNGDIAFGSHIKKLEKQLESIHNNIKAFDSSLSNIFGSASTNRLNDDELLRFIYRSITMDFKAGELSHLTEVINPILVNENGFKIGHEQIGMVTLVREGSSVSTGRISRPNVNQNLFGNSGSVKLPVSFAYPLGLGLPFDHILISHVEVLDNEMVVSKVKSENTWLKLGRVMSGVLEAKYNANMEFIELITSHDASSCHLGMNVIIKDGNNDRLLEKISEIRTAFGQMEGAIGQVENLDTLPLWIHSLPGCRVDYDRKLLSLLHIGVCYFPVESMSKSDDEGFYFKDRFATPVKVNFWYSEAVTNVNMVLIGPSGSGKSFMQNTLLDKAYGAQDHIIIMDVGHSYKGLCESKGGKYFDSEDKASLGVNIFDINTELPEEELIGKKILILDVIKVIWKGNKGLTNEERTILQKVISEFVISDNIKNVKGFYDFLAENQLRTQKAHNKYIDYDSLLLNLEPFVNGSEKWVFDGGKGHDMLDERFIVFSLFALAKQEVLMTVYSLIVIDLILEKLRRLPKSVRKRIAMDEVWMLFKSDMVEYIEYFFRTVRKEGGGIGVITQNVNDIETSGIADAIKINTDIKVLLKHKALNDDTRNSLRKTLGLNSQDLEMLESLQRKEFFVKFGELAGVYINDVSYQNELLYSTAPKDVENIKVLAEEYGSKDAAIAELTYRKNIKSYER